MTNTQETKSSNPWDFTQVSMGPTAIVIQSLLNYSTLMLEIGQMSQLMARLAANISSSEAQLVGAFQQEQGEAQKWDSFLSGMGQVLGGVSQMVLTGVAYWKNESDIANLEEGKQLTAAREFQSELNGDSSTNVSLSDMQEGKSLSEQYEMSKKINERIDDLQEKGVDAGKSDVGISDKQVFDMASTEEQRTINEKIEKQVEALQNAKDKAEAKLDKKLNMHNSMISGLNSALQGLGTATSGSQKEAAANAQAAATVMQNVEQQVTQVEQALTQQGQTYIQQANLLPFIEQLNESNRFTG